jgi:hypothetical protein
MDNITMTIDATAVSRVRSVRPEAHRVLLTGARGWIQGTTVPASVAVITADQAPTFYVGGFGAGAKDLEFRPFGEPPV